MSNIDVSIQNEILKKKHNIKKRLSFMLLDVFFGGFIVSVILLVTLGRPDAESPAEGAGGAPVIVVEYFWKNKHQLFSPIVTFNGQRLNVTGLASPWGAPGNGLWYGHDITTGRLDYHSTLKPFSFIVMDGFHLDPGDVVSLVKNTGNDVSDTIYYAQVIVSTPCAGQWNFGLRSVERGIGSSDTNTFDVDMRLSFSYGPGKKTLQPEELEKLYSGKELIQDRSNLFDAIKNQEGNVVTRTIDLPPDKALEAHHC